MQVGGRKDKIMIKMTKMSTLLPLTSYFKVFREAPGVMIEAYVKHKNTQNADTVKGKHSNIIKNRQKHPKSRRFRKNVILRVYVDFCSPGAVTVIFNK